MSDTFRIATPSYDPATGIARFPYALGELRFTETLAFPPGGDTDVVRRDHHRDRRQRIPALGRRHGAVERLGGRGAVGDVADLGGHDRPA